MVAIQGLVMNANNCGIRTKNGSNYQEKRAGARVKPDGGEPSLDEVLKTLADSRRRVLLYYLQDHEVTTVDELTRHIVAQEAETPAEKGSNVQRERIEVELVHTDLPQLRNSNFIEYDSRSRTVRYSQPPEHIQKVLWLLARFEEAIQE